MRVATFILLFTAFSFASIAANSDSTYYLMVGNKKCPLIFHEKLDSTIVTVKVIPNPTTQLLDEIKGKSWDAHKFLPGSLDTILEINPITLENDGDVTIVKDTIITVKYLVEQAVANKTHAFTRKTLRVDTVMEINPLTLGEDRVIIPYHKFEIENDLGNVDFTSFIKQIKTGLVIEGKSRKLHIDEIGFYYETQDDCNWITLHYPNPDTLLLKKLTALNKGGFIIIWDLTVQGGFITKPVYLKTYFSVNNPLARPEATIDLSAIQRIPYPNFQGAVPPLRYNASIGRLYVGMENQLTFSAPGISPENIRAVAEGNISVSQNISDPRIFTVTANYSYEPAVIHFVQVVNGDSSEIHTDSFLITRLPDPRLSLNGKLWGGRVTKESLQATSGIVPLMTDFRVPSRFTVKEFYMTYSSKGKINSAYATGPMFNAQMIQWINQSQKDDIFIIDSDKIEGPDRMPYYSMPIIFIISQD